MVWFSVVDKDVELLGEFSVSGTSKESLLRPMDCLGGRAVRCLRDQPKRSTLPATKNVVNKFQVGGKESVDLDVAL